MITNYGFFYIINEIMWYIFLFLKACFKMKIFIILLSSGSDSNKKYIIII